MSNPMKPHTQGSRGAFFIHVLALFPDDVIESLAKSMAETGIDCLLDFLAEDVQYLMTELTDKERSLNMKEKRILKNIHEWLTWESTNQPGIDSGTLFMTNYDVYLTQKFAGSTNLQPDIPTFTTLPTMM